MDFRFRPENRNAPSHPYFFPPDSHNNNYFTEQAMRAGYFNNGIISDSNPVRDEAIQREIEKRRIREEIIAAELIRSRRELEAEVRREMAMEKQLGFPLLCNSLDYNLNNQVVDASSSRLQDKFSISLQPEVGSFGRLPFQRHPDAVKTTEIKPAIPSITGIKRKITAIGVNGFASCSTKKKPRKEWSCALCKVSATSQKDLDSHLQSRKHKARELGLMRAKGAISSEIEGSSVSMTVPLQIKPAIPSITGIKRKITAIGVNGFASCSTKKKPRKKWSCALCKVSATSQKDLDSHLQSRKHKARELGLMRAKGAISSEIEGSSVSMTVPLQIKPAIPSITGIKRKITAIGVNGFASCSTKKKPRKEWSCALCKVSATSQKDLDSHLQSRKHKARELGLMRAKGAINSEIEGSSVSKHSDELDLANASSSSVLGDEGKKIPAGNDIESVQKDEAANEHKQNDNLQGEEDEDDEAELNMKGVENKDIESSITFVEKPKINSRCNPIGGKVHIEGSITLPEKPEGSKINSRCNPVGGKMPAKAMKSENCAEAILQKNQNPEDVRKKFKFWCEHCQIGCQSAINLAVHETGKKHMAQIRTLKQDNEEVKLDVRKNVKAVAKRKTEDFKEKFKYWCERCQVGCKTKRKLASHEKGKKHMLRVTGRDIWYIVSNVL
ncbi:hypothetical protein MKX03_020847 [Papaver bracteatum]|nr:hypothetical protein MKX03_020847 [Papaver bracteatum]